MIYITKNMEKFLSLLKSGYKNRYNINTNCIYEYHEYGNGINLSRCRENINNRIPIIHAKYLIENGFMYNVNGIYYPSIEVPTYTVKESSISDMAKYKSEKYPDKIISYLTKLNKCEDLK